MASEKKTGVSSKDLPYSIEFRGTDRQVAFRVYAPPVLGTDAAGEPVLGREYVECATDDEVKVFEAFEAIEAERDELLLKVAALSKPAQSPAVPQKPK